MTAEKQSALQTIEEKRDMITGIADKIWEFGRAFPAGVQIRSRLL